MDPTELDSRIDALEQKLSAWFSTPDGNFFRECWGLIKTIGSGFKGTRYPSGVQHQAAWSRFQDLVDKVKSEESKFRDRLEAQAGSSASIKRDVIRMAGAAWPRPNGFDRIIGMVTGITAMEFVVSAGIEALFSVIGLGDKRTELQKRLDTLKNLSGYVKEAWAYFERQKQNMLPRDRTEAFKVLQEVSNELNAAWQEWKNANEQQFKERQKYRNDREADFERKRDQKRALIRAAERLNSNNKSDSDRAKELATEWKAVGFAGKDYEDTLWQEFRSALDAFWARSRSARGDRLREVLSGKREQREKLLTWIVREASKISEFEEKRDGAWNESYREKMESIIEDIESRLAENRRKLESVEEAIEDIERKLDDL